MDWTSPNVIDIGGHENHQYHGINFGFSGRAIYSKIILKCIQIRY